MPDPTQTDPTVRLQKFLSQAGVCSRRKGEELMASGRVSVNGKVVTELGARIDPTADRVTVDGKPVTTSDPPVYVALNKPRGVITTLEDPEDRTKVADLLPSALPRTWPVGRLDWESEGLLLMTNDGTLTHLLTHPSTCVEKTYTVKIAGHLDPHDPRVEQMRQGMTLDDGFQTSAAEVTFEGSTDKNTWLSVILHEGHNRQIRRMCEVVHLDVLRLRRVSIGQLQLEPLKPGDFRFLTADEVRALYAAANAAPPDTLAAYNPGRLSDLIAPRARKPAPGRQTEQPRTNPRAPRARDAAASDDGRAPRRDRKATGPGASDTARDGQKRRGRDDRKTVDRAEPPPRPRAERGQGRPRRKG